MGKSAYPDPGGIYFASGARQIAVRWAALLAGLLLVAAVIFTYSRGDTVALAAMLVVAAIYKRPPLQFVLGGLLAIGVMLVLPAFDVLSESGHAPRRAEGRRASNNRGVLSAWESGGSVRCYLHVR